MPTTATLEKMFNIGAMFPGVPGASAIVFRLPVTRALTFPAGMPFSRAVLLVAPTASTVFSIQKNDVEFATITFAAGAMVGTFTSASDTSLVAGDILSIVAPGTPDGTAADLGVTLAGDTGT